MPLTDECDDLRRQLAHADAVIAELRGVVADLRKQVEAQQAHIHRLVKMTFGRGGERVEGPTLFDGIDLPEAEAIQRSLDLSEALSQTGDFKEGVTAFAEKRPAQWRDKLDRKVFGA